MDSPRDDARELLPPTLPVVTQLRGEPSARPWLDRLPALIAEVRDRFDLRLGAPLPAGSCSWVAPAELPDRTPVIVKIGWPHREMLAEPAALRLWDGDGAVRLLAHDPHRHALLLERCLPGRQLAEDPAPAEHRLRIGGDVLRRLWAKEPARATKEPAREPIEPLHTVAVETAGTIEERMERLRPGYDPGLVAEGVRRWRELPTTATRTTVLHGDANPGNLLSSGRGWLAIDPKPLTGDPAYDPWPLLEQVDDPFAYPDPVKVLRARAGRLADLLDLDGGRIVAWALARRVDAALWLADRGDTAAGAALMREAHLLGRL